MIVISDTSPLNYLVLIEVEQILPALFGEIVLPTAVFEELRSAAAPDRLRDWLATSPPWTRVEAPPAITPELMRLDAGERGLAVAGTLGVLDRAAGPGDARVEGETPGEMAERLKAHAWKACIGEALSRVRIPLSPPDDPFSHFKSFGAPYGICPRIAAPPTQSGFAPAVEPAGRAW